MVKKNEPQSIGHSAMTLCYRCLCDVCSNINCPAGRRWFITHGKMDWCIRCNLLGACPRVVCDAFVHSSRKRFYRRKDGKTREDKIFDALGELRDMIQALEERIKDIPKD